MKHKAPAKIPLVGSGNWDTTIAGKHNNDFDPEVRMLIHEEIVNGKKLLRKLRITDFTAICNSGRNRKICEAFVKTKKSIQDLEREMLDGQSIQGPATAEAIFMMLKKHNLISRFPVHHCGTSNM